MASRRGAKNISLCLSPVVSNNEPNLSSFYTRSAHDSVCCVFKRGQSSIIISNYVPQAKFSFLHLIFFLFCQNFNKMMT